MRARLHRLSVGATRVRSRLRGLFPDGDRPYELFDVAVLLVGLALISYVFTQPPMTVELGLVVPLQLFPREVWGTALALLGVVVAGLAYHHRTLRAGYVLLFLGTSFWSGSFLLGVLFFDAPGRNLGAALLYGWMARRVFRDGIRPEVLS